MRFSRTRLAPEQSARRIPLCHQRWPRAPAAVPSRRWCAGEQPFGNPAASSLGCTLGWRPFAPAGSVVHAFTATMASSDSRSALPRFAAPHRLSGSSLPVHRRAGTSTVFRLRRTGAKTGISCSHIGSPTVPCPLRRGVLRGCTSKRFTPSLAFAPALQARLPVVPPLGGSSSRRGRLRFIRLRRTDRWVAPPHGRLDPALRRTDLSVRRRAATKAAWSLLWPDSHRLVDVSFRTHSLSKDGIVRRQG